MSKLRPALAALSLLAFTPAFADHEGDGAHAAVHTLTGTLVSRAADAVVLKDTKGTPHRIRVDSRTRYVWTETANVRDFAPGATVRAEYEAQGAPVATAVWILSPPARR